MDWGYFRVRNEVLVIFGIVLVTFSACTSVEIDKCTPIEDADERFEKAQIVRPFMNEVGSDGLEHDTFDAYIEGTQLSVYDCGPNSKVIFDPFLGEMGFSIIFVVNNTTGDLVGYSEK